VKRAFWITAILIVVILAAAALTLPPKTAQALPEYSALTGEPCATCHISPSGGGNRTPRGQAWVGSNKPAAVPDLVQALELLGVHLDVDQSQFQAPTSSPSPALPLKLETGKVQEVRRWLEMYAGN